MFSKPLFKQSVKSNLGIWSVMTIIMCVLIGQFTAMEETKALINPMFYGMMAVIIPTIYVIVSGNNLLANQVDRGSMAYILSTPIKRSKVVITQIIFLVGSLAVMFIITTAIHTMIGVVINDDTTFELVLKLNFGAFLVAAALGGICFMFSGIFNLSKHATGSGGLICIVFMMFNMLALFGQFGIKGIDGFKYLTIVSLFDITSIVAGASEWIWKLCILVGIAVVTYLIGSIAFSKKDLPL